MRDGGVRCWGQNDRGQLGGQNPPPGGPVKVAGLPAPVRELTAGGSHTCALLTTDDLYCWGNNHDGQLGVGSLGDFGNPVKVPSPFPVAQGVARAAGTHL